MVSPYSRRAEHRFAVYVLVHGRAVLWDDADDEEAAHQLGRDTLMPYRIADTHSTDLPWRQLR